MKGVEVQGVQGYEGPPMWIQHHLDHGIEVTPIGWGAPFCVPNRVLARWLDEALASAGFVR